MQIKWKENGNQQHKLISNYNDSKFWDEMRLQQTGVLHWGDGWRTEFDKDEVCAAARQRHIKQIGWKIKDLTKRFKKHKRQLRRQLRRLQKMMKRKMYRRLGSLVDKKEWDAKWAQTWDTRKLKRVAKQH